MLITSTQVHIKGGPIIVSNVVSHTLTSSVVHWDDILFKLDHSKLFLHHPSCFNFMYVKAILCGMDFTENVNSLILASNTDFNKKKKTIEDGYTIHHKIYQNYKIFKFF